MALPPLATVADCTARGLTVEGPEVALLTTYLDTASAAIREAAGAPISQTTSTLDIEGELGQWLSLPGPPVTAVAAVFLEDQAVTDWRLRSGRLWRAGGWARGDGPAEVTVTYTHGLPSVPADIVDLVCRIAATTLLAYRSADGGEGLAARDVRSERIGDYSVQFGDGGRITEMELPEYLREQLAARFGGGISLLRSR
ncbi:hypothetical protein DMA15_17605 [Streptomyces sp. WAC 01529]|uniref:hypothetical protein n=1 Tax=Streptomyces sp. WAC 01529 TaxID=2203205 RepID=UPI000F6E7AE7|nr:hypothetical protein [Streptomyces sp. WAC 01529]AZM54161.1 hypothetical protein DMA15_17605 [Streptomyces sp. WAC 01529]